MPAGRREATWPTRPVVDPITGRRTWPITSVSVRADLQVVPDSLDHWGGVEGGGMPYGFLALIEIRTVRNGRSTVWRLQHQVDYERERGQAWHVTLTNNTSLEGVAAEIAEHLAEVRDSFVRLTAGGVCVARNGRRLPATVGSMSRERRRAWRDIELRISLSPVCAETLRAKAEREGVPDAGDISSDALTARVKALLDRSTPAQ